MPGPEPLAENVPLESTASAIEPRGSRGGTWIWSRNLRKSPRRWRSKVVVSLSEPFPATVEMKFLPLHSVNLATLLWWPRTVTWTSPEEPAPDRFRSATIWSGAQDTIFAVELGPPMVTDPSGRGSAPKLPLIVSCPPEPENSFTYMLLMLGARRPKEELAPGVKLSVTRNESSTVLTMPTLLWLV